MGPGPPMAAPTVRVREDLATRCLRATVTRSIRGPEETKQGTGGLRAGMPLSVVPASQERGYGLRRSWRSWSKSDCGRGAGPPYLSKQSVAMQIRTAPAKIPTGAKTITSAAVRARLT